LKYVDIVEGIFIYGPNRFITNAIIGGIPKKARIKNTGRCKEILKKERNIKRNSTKK